MSNRPGSVLKKPIKIDKLTVKSRKRDLFNVATFGRRVKYSPTEHNVYNSGGNHSELLICSAGEW